MESSGRPRLGRLLRLNARRQPVLDDPVGYVTGSGSDIFWGAFLELLLIIANIGTAVVLFPVLRRQNEILAVGYVTARIVECVFIAVGILAVLTVVTLGQERSDAEAGSGLVPRRLAMLGLIGGPLNILSGLLVMFGVIDQGGTAQGIATTPEFFWELGLGLYLTVWGFRPSPVIADWPAGRQPMREAGQPA